MVALTAISVSLLLSAVATPRVSGTKQPDGDVCDGAACPDAVSLLQLRFATPVSSHMAKSISNTSWLGTPDKAKTIAAFVAAGGDSATITDTKWAYIKAAVADISMTDKYEYAMFFANLMQESGLLTVTKESSDHFDENDYDWDNGKYEKDVSKVHYFGRGYLQLTWKKNYEAAKEWGCNKSDIVADPDKVAEDEELAWCVSAWYWLENVNKDRCDKNRDGERECEMGNTIHAINGALECNDGTADCEEHAKNRFCYYKDFFESYSYPTKLSYVGSECCKNMDANCRVA